MNKKTIKINLFYIFLTLFIFCIPFNQYFAEEITEENSISTVEEAKNEEESEFNFIKSDNCDNGLFYSDNWLLYGGIALIIISIAGIIITLKPSILRRNKHSKRKSKNRK